jgi:hypothetical protein
MYVLSACGGFLFSRKQADRGFAAGVVFVVRLGGGKGGGVVILSVNKCLMLRGGYGFTKKKVNPPQADKIDGYC